MEWGIYTPLDTPVSSIRLLGLPLPPPYRCATNFIDSRTPSYVLRTFPLNETPPYFALSHRWNNEPKRSCIRLNGIRAYTSRSLADGIVQLQTFGREHSEKDENVLWVWIDTLCINQNDTSERLEQIQIMRNIYSQAIRTLVWLGPETYPCSEAWALIDRIYRIVEGTIPQVKSVADISFRLYSDHAHTSVNLPSWGSNSWQHLRALFRLEWFTRTWIIQEVVLSRADPILLHGNRRYPWHRLGWAASWLRRNGYIRLPQVPVQLLNVEMISNIRRSGSFWKLDALLLTTSTKFHATDQKDKLYGLLGIASECSDDVDATEEPLRPRHDGDVIEVYIKVGLFLIQRSESLAVLTRATGLSLGVHDAQRKFKLHRLPSWVPNWSDFEVTERDMPKSLAWLDQTHVTQAPQIGFPKHYRASAHIPTKVLETPDPSLLRLGGLRVDTVLCATKFDSRTALSSLPPLVQLWVFALDHQPESIHVMGYLKHWIQVTTAEHHGLAGITAEQGVKNGAAYLVEHWNGMGCVSSKLLALADGGDPDSFECLAKNFCSNRKFIVTAAGRMGIAPCSTEPGDIVCVLFGGGVPYILRPQSQSFFFVGESYIHDLADGQAIKAWEREEISEEVFSLL